MNRPERSEYADFYEDYVSNVPEDDIVAALEEQQNEIAALFSGISDEKGLYAYAEGKWTIKELLGHLTDCEQVFAYRALRFASGDETPLPGFDQDPCVANGNSNQTSMKDLLDEFLAHRKASVIFFRNLPAEAWRRSGIASDNPVTVRALSYMLVGHVRHHTKILKERYLA
jgi:hypothetical protein